MGGKGHAAQLTAYISMYCSDWLGMNHAVRLWALPQLGNMNTFPVFCVGTLESRRIPTLGADFGQPLCG